MPEVVVTEKSPREKEQPEASERITREDMDAFGAYDLRSALAPALDVNVSRALGSSDSAMGGGSLMIRGMDTNGTLLLWNGMPVADEDFNVTENAMALERIPFFDVDHIDILRGAEGAAYGSGAMGGVVNLAASESPEEVFEADALTSTDRMSSFFKYGTGNQGRWNVVLSGNRGKIRPVTYRRNGSSYLPEYGNDRGISLRGTYRLSPDSSLKFGWLNQEERHHVKMPSKGRIDRDLGGGWLSYERNSGQNKYHVNFMETELRKWTTLPSGGRSSFDLRWIDAGGERAFSRGSLFYGASYKKTGREGSDLSDGNQHTQESGAFYLRGYWHPFRKWTVAPAFRLERENGGNVQAVPAIGLTWEFNDSSRLKMNYGLGYKRPTLGEKYVSMMHATPIGPVYVRGNPDLKEEKSRNFDISFEMERGSYQGKFSYFENHVRHLIEAHFLGGRPFSGLFYRYENQDRARIRGAEAEIGRSFGFWKTKLSYVYLDAANGDGERLNNRGRQIWTASVSYRSPSPYGWSGTLWNSFL